MSTIGSYRIIEPRDRIRVETGFTADGVGRGKAGWTLTLPDGRKIVFSAGALEGAMDRALLVAKVDYEKWKETTP